MLTPLELPRSDEYADWFATRCSTHLGQARELADQLKTLDPSVPRLVVERWNDVNVALSNVFSVSSLTSQVHPEAALRETAEAVEQDAQRLLTDLSLDRAVYEVLAAVDPDLLDEGARRVLDKTLRDFHRAGVDRTDEVRARLRELSELQTSISQEFSRAIRDGVGRFTVDPARLTGLPADFVDRHEVDADGLVELTTEYPDYVPVMTFALDRDLREQMLLAFMNRAWPDNDATLRRLLEVRRETAQILGYRDWPTYDAEVKMIGTGHAIPEFIERIAELSVDSGRRDLQVILERLRKDHPSAMAVDWVDKSFYSEVVRRERFEVDAQQVRAYFDFAKVRAGLLAVTSRLFGLEYVEVEDAPRWHADVTAYDVHADGRLIGRIYLDLHPRAGKYSHAAQFDLVSGVADRQLPEGVLVCNFPRGLMEHNEVVTLFHEFGHLVHHVLAGRHEWVRFSGVATEWDFVEAPSQMLEEWAWDHAVLASFATNAAGEPIPADLVARMRTADEFGKGFAARTQMFYAAVSYYLHQQVPDDLTASVQDLQSRYDLFAGVEGTHLQASFGHLGGYTSAYYTYMWSLVIAKDLFSAFDPEDLFAPGVALRYRDRILAAGGSQDAADLVADFLGRPYSFAAFDAWLDHG